MATYTPNHEDITGASLSGSTGDLNRTYTLANEGAILAQMQIILAENVLQNAVNFTYDAETNIVTFLSAVFNDQNISLDYLTSEDTPVTGFNYCTTLQIARASGIGVEVFTENLGTGDNSATSFDLANGNVIDNSYTVKYAAANSNSFNNMVEDTHYTILKDQGLIELTTAGKTLLDTDVLYIDYVYSPRHSDTLLTSYIAPATAEVNLITNNYWGPERTSIQYFDGYTSGYPQTDEPYGTQIEPYPEFTLKYKSIIAITSVLFLDKKGDTDTTLDSNQYRVITDEDELNDYNESRLLVNTNIPNGKANIKATFTHGYTNVPDLIQELTALVGGVMALVNISGGSYKDVSTYSLGRKSFSIGQIYVNVRESIDQMKSRIDYITNLMGGNFDCA